MTAQKNNPIEQSDDRAIVISRVVDAPRELVWEAMTNPRHIVNWWGPRGFTTTIEVMDVRPGGEWKHVMHGPDGTDYPNRMTFTEIVKPERICFAHGGAKKAGPQADFQATWTFDTVESGRTRVTIRMVFPSVEARDKVVQAYGAIEGGKQTLERLAEHLPRMSATADFVISRVFDATRELVWKAWTEPARLARWGGPRVVTTPICEMDVRTGGKYRFVMRAADGEDYPIQGVFQEVVPHERLVWTMDCSGHPQWWHDMVNPDRKGDPNPAGEMLSTVTFEDVSGKTKITIRVSMKSAAIRDNMVKMGMNDGWSQSLDRLAELLAEC